MTARTTEHKLALLLRPNIALADYPPASGDQLLLVLSALAPAAKMLDYAQAGLHRCQQLTAGTGAPAAWLPTP